MTGLATRPVAPGRGTLALARWWFPTAALVRRDLKRRYATTMIGLGWTVLQPLVLIAVYLLVFGTIIQVDVAGAGAHGFAFFMLSGMLPYLAWTDALFRAAGALREDRALFEREDFPAEVVPASRVVAAAVPEVVALTLFVAVGAFFGLSVSGWLLTLPLLVALRVVIAFGHAWLVSVLTVFITDLAEVLSLLLTAWLFLTPIFYRVEAVPPAMRWVLAINPLHHVVEAYRAVLLEGRAPFPELWPLLGWVVVIGGGGLWFFRVALPRAKDFL